MKVVHIYLGASSQFPRKIERTWGYVLECESSPGNIRNGFNIQACTHNQAIIRALIRALERMTQPCQLHIHSQNEYVLNMLNRNLDSWAANGFLNKKGHQVLEEWQMLYPLKARHQVSIKTGLHTYSDMLIQTMKHVKEPIEDIEMQGQKIMTGKDLGI